MDFGVALLVVWMAACAVQDARQRRISNVLTLGALALGVVYLIWRQTSPLGAPATDVALAAGVALALTLPGFLLGRMGAGDVKLLLSLALLSDLQLLLLSIAGAMLGMLVWLWLGPRLWPRLPPRAQHWVGAMQPDKTKQPPYAPFVFVAMIAALCALY